jgi:hypothetical protein
MVGRCANPDCSATFAHLGEGALFHFDMRLATVSDTKCEFCGRPHHVRHYWLCPSCSKAMTITFLRDGTVILRGRAGDSGSPVALCSQGKVA